MQLMKPAEHLLEKPDALRARFAHDGYVYLRGVLDQQSVAVARDGLVDYLVGQECAVAGSDPPTSTGADTAGLGQHPPDLHRRNLWQNLAAERSVQAVVSALLGPSPISIPIAQYQFKSPVPTGTPWSGCHQDHFYNPGMWFRTFWIPLVAMEESVGGLAVAHRCHTEGFLHDRGTLNASIPPDSLPAEVWRRANYRPGDLVIFHGYTPHLGLPNLDASRLRLSVDIRFQTADDPRPIIGIVDSADDHQLHVTDAEGSTTTVTIEPDTVVRTNLAESMSHDALVGKHVICAVDAGHAVLVRTIA